jgi:hypothetical protein
MIDEVKRLILVGIEGILKSPQYTISLMKCYSKIYLGGAQCDSCERSLRKYFDKLKYEAMTKLELMQKVAVRTLKPSFKGMVFSPQAGHINPEMLYDEIAIDYLNKGILQESHFEILPVGYKKPQNVIIERPKELVKENIKEPVKEPITENIVKKTTKNKKK